MAIVVGVFTPDQETRIREIFREEIAAWYAAPIPNVKDRDGKGYSRYQADVRGVYGYDIGRDGGALEKRSDVLEARANADDLDDAAEAAVQVTIQAALAKPILP